MKKRTDGETNLDGGGGKNRITVPGKYHLICFGPEDGIESEDQAKMEFKVIGTADPSQMDKTTELRVEFEVLHPSDDPDKLKKQQHMTDAKLAQVTSALAMTEMTRGEVATMDKWREWLGNDVEFNFEQALGRQIVAEIEIREFDMKNRETGQPTGEKGYVPEIKKYWTIFSPVDPKAASGGYPLNPQYVAMLGGTVAPQVQQVAVQPVQQPVATQQTAPQQTAPPAAAVADPWAAFK